MTYKRPTPAELLARIQSEFDIHLPSSDARLRRSVENVLARILVIASHDLNGFLEYISKQITVATADNEFLERHAGIWGVTRIAATKATGSIDFIGTNGAVIVAGSILQRGDDVQYVLDTDVTIIGGVATAAITAVTPEANGNSDAGTKLNLISPISGVQTETTVSVDGVTGGADIETDDTLSARIIARIQQPPHGGASFDYITWAKEIAGVTRAWSYPEQLGTGTVSVTFIMDDNAGSIIPAVGDVDNVQSHIDALCPVGADVTVFAPTPTSINFDITVSPNSVAVQTAIKAEIEDLFKREAEPSGTLYLSRIQEAISTATGEFNHILNSPAADIVMPFGQMPITGTFTWS